MAINRASFRGLVVAAQLLLLLLPAITKSDSNLVRRYQRLNLIESLPIPPFELQGELPHRIKERIAQYSIEWKDISGLLQRALLWDSGYVLGEHNEPHEVFSKCGSSMKDLLVPYSEFIQICAAHSCEDGFGNRIYRSHDCDGKALLSIAQCATHSVTRNSTASIWAQENKRSDKVVDPKIFIHQRENEWSMLAIHVVEQTEWGSCPTKPELTDVIIPCADFAQVNKTKWCPPHMDPEVDVWLREESQVNYQSGDPKKTIPHEKLWTVRLIVLVCIAIALFLVILVLCWMNQNVGKKPDLGSSSYTDVHSTRSLDKENVIQSATIMSNCSSSDFPRFRREKIPEGPQVPNLSFIIDKREWIPYMDIVLLHQIGSGSFGEVHMGILNSTYVAVKKLHSWAQPEDMKQFRKEIKLLKSLNHPNIIHYIGLTSLSRNSKEICSVCEYMQMGDLRDTLDAISKIEANDTDMMLLSGTTVDSDTELTFLEQMDGATSDRVSFSSMEFRHRHKSISSVKEIFTWQHLKLSIAIDIISGLTYLHKIRPSIIHRDLKSRNILLNEGYTAKISDFGISKEKSASSSSMRILGSNLWLSPELICGENYDEKADIYSFGIVLSELDTLQLPYWNVRTELGQRLHGIGIINLVAYKGLRPELSSRVPSVLRDVFDQCTKHCPRNRPTAAEVLEVLQQYQCNLEKGIEEQGYSEVLF